MQVPSAPLSSRTISGMVIARRVCVLWPARIACTIGAEKRMGRNFMAAPNRSADFVLPAADYGGGVGDVRAGSDSGHQRSYGQLHVARCDPRGIRLARRHPLVVGESADLKFGLRRHESDRQIVLLPQRALRRPTH